MSFRLSSEDESWIDALVDAAHRHDMQHARDAQEYKLIEYGSQTITVRVVEHRCTPVWCSVCRQFQVRPIAADERSA